MKPRLLVALAVTAACLAWAGSALARNPHCAGGIQYYSQAMADKEKGNTEDYAREIAKAVMQLESCAGEDPADFEALGYLGRAYTEVDSAGPAGDAFAKSIAGAEAKGDKKKLDSMIGWRDAAWTGAFNKGVQAIQEGQQYADAGAKDEAHTSLAKAIAQLTKAKLIRPGSARTLRSLASAYALDGDFDAADAVLTNGMTEAAADTSVHQLGELLNNVRTNKANMLLDAGKLEEAAAYYTKLSQADPKSANIWSGLGMTNFKRAEATKVDADRKAAYRAAAEAYVKASEIKPDNPDFIANAAAGFQASGDLAKAEVQYRALLVKSPNDAEAYGSLGEVLRDENKFPDAIAAMLKAISLKPDERRNYQVLGGIYSKAGNNDKSTEMLLVYLAMKNGQPVPDVAATVKAAKPGTAAANTATAMGAPEKIYEWDDTSGAGKAQTWFYTAKQMAFTFNSAGVLMKKSDWSAAKK